LCPASDEGAIGSLMLVSVIIPTHNRSRWLRLTLRTVLWQKHVDLEAIVVDDASTDETPEAIAAFADSRVRVLRHDRSGGVARSRNHGAEEARGEWIAFLDDDDLWAPDKLSRQLIAAAASDRQWAYTGSVNIDEHLRVTSGVRPLPPHEVARSIFRRNTIPGGGSNVAIRRDLFLRAGPFDVRHRNTEDWDLWIRLAEAGMPAWVPEPLMAKRIHASNASLDIAAIFAGVALIEQRRGVRTDRGVLHRWIAESSLRTGQRRDAVKHMALAAARGQALPVSRDVLLILRRRLDRHTGHDPFAGGRGNESQWIARAQEWIRELIQE
jgi:glycosyltransferase involved in cell wall biosynthesis